CVFGELAGDVAGADFGLLDVLADAVDDFGVGEGGDVADVGEVGHGCDDAAHDLAGSGFGHVGDDPDVLGAGDFGDLGFDGLGDFGFHPVGVGAGFEGDVHFDHPAADVVDDGDGGPPGGLRVRARGRQRHLVGVVR